MNNNQGVNQFKVSKTENQLPWSKTMGIPIAAKMPVSSFIGNF